MRNVAIKKTLVLIVAITVFPIFSVSAYSADKLVVKNATSTQVFKVNDTGDVFTVGKIGVGGTSIYPMYVQSSIRDIMYLSRPGGGSVRLGINSTSNSGLGLFINDVKKWSSAIYLPLGKTNFGYSFYNDQTATDSLFIDGDTNYVGIGINNPTHRLELSGGAYSDGATWVNASSRELKENIKEVTAESAIATLDALEPVQYNYKKDKEEQHVGFIAEDVPDMVATNDRKGMSTMDVTAVLTKVVQEQHKMLKELKIQVAELKFDLEMKKDKDVTASR